MASLYVTLFVVVCRTWYMIIDTHGSLSECDGIEKATSCQPKDLNALHVYVIATWLYSIRVDLECVVVAMFLSMSCIVKIQGGLFQLDVSNTSHLFWMYFYVDCIPYIRKIKVAASIYWMRSFPDSILPNGHVLNDKLPDMESEETPLEQLIRHWMNERNAPDILPAQEFLLNRLLDHLRRQVRIFTYARHLSSPDAPSVVWRGPASTRRSLHFRGRAPEDNACPDRDWARQVYRKLLC